MVGDHPLSQVVVNFSAPTVVREKLSIQSSVMVTCSWTSAPRNLCETVKDQDEMSRLVAQALEHVAVTAASTMVPRSSAKPLTHVARAFVAPGGEARTSCSR